MRSLALPFFRARRVAALAALVAPLATTITSMVLSNGGCKVVNGASPTSGASSGATSTTNGTGGASSSTSGAGGTGGNLSNLTCHQLFTATVEPGLETNCVPCHVNGGFADFLAPPDPYTSITIYKSGTNHEPLLVSPADTSILYTYPDNPDHGNGTGTHYTPAHVALKQAVLTWLTCEAKSLPPPPEAGPSTYLAPFKPILGGFNVIYLDALGPSFVGSSIVFEATQLGTPASLLQISNLAVYPAGIALHIVHPRFLVLPSGSAVGQPEPSDALSDVDEVFTPSGLVPDGTGGAPSMPTRLLGSGEVLIDNWQEDARLELDFSMGSISTINLTEDGGIVTPCNRPDLYQDAVTSLGDGGPHYCAAMCHGGNKPTAQAAMNLAGLLQTPPDYATACSYMLTRVTPGDPATSQILEVTDPMNIQVIHMYKFAGDQSAYAAFNTGMSPWITAE